MIKVFEYVIYGIVALFVVTFLILTWALSNIPAVGWIVVLFMGMMLAGWHQHLLNYKSYPIFSWNKWRELYSVKVPVYEEPWIDSIIRLFKKPKQELVAGFESDYLRHSTKLDAEYGQYDHE